MKGFNYHFSEREIDVIRALEGANYDMDEAAKIVGLKTNTVRSYAKCVGNKLGHKKKFEKRPVTKEMLEFICDEYAKFVKSSEESA